MRKSSSEDYYARVNGDLIVNGNQTIKKNIDIVGNQIVKGTQNIYGNEIINDNISNIYYIF